MSNPINHICVCENTMWYFGNKTPHSSLWIYEIFVWTSEQSCIPSYKIVFNFIFELKRKFLNLVFCFLNVYQLCFVVVLNLYQTGTLFDKSSIIYQCFHVPQSEFSSKRVTWMWYWYQFFCKWKSEMRCAYSALLRLCQ